MGAKQIAAFCPASWIKLLSHSESGSSDSEIINPYLTNRFSHHYQMGKSIFIFRGVRSVFLFIYFIVR